MREQKTEVTAAFEHLLSPRVVILFRKKTFQNAGIDQMKGKLLRVVEMLVIGLSMEILESGSMG